MPFIAIIHNSLRRYFGTKLTDTLVKKKWIFGGGGDIKFCRSTFIRSFQGAKFDRLKNIDIFNRFKIEGPLHNTDTRLLTFYRVIWI